MVVVVMVAGVFLCDNLKVLPGHMQGHAHGRSPSCWVRSHVEGLSQALPGALTVTGPPHPPALSTAREEGRGTQQEGGQRWLSVAAVRGRQAERQVRPRVRGPWCGGCWGFWGLGSGLTVSLEDGTGHCVGRGQGQPWGGRWPHQDVFPALPSLGRTLWGRFGVQIPGPWTFTTLACCDG